jgi:hypothetical protein
MARFGRGTVSRVKPSAVALTVFAAGLLAGAMVGATLRAPSTGGDPAAREAMQAELDRLNGTVANMSAALAQAQAEARLAEVAANQAGVTEVTSAMAEVERFLEAGRRSDAFEPLRGLISAAGNTSWAPLLRFDAAAAHGAATRLYDRLSFGTPEEANRSAADLREAVAALAATFRDLYLPYHRASPVGELIESTANISGFYVRDVAGIFARNPTLHLRVGATMLVEVTNMDAFNHSFAVPDLRLITRTALPGETVGLVVGPAPAGEYRYLCDVGGHEAGMHGTLVVAP